MDETHKQYAHNAYAMTSKASLIQYLYQAAFSPPKATLLIAVYKNQFVTWPGLTVNAVKKYLPDSSPETDKGHMKRQKQGIRITKEKIMTALSTIETARYINPSMEKETQNQIFFPSYTGTKSGNNIRRLHRQLPHPTNTQQSICDVARTHSESSKKIPARLLTSNG